MPAGFGAGGLRVGDRGIDRAFRVELQFRVLGLYGSLCLAVGGVFWGKLFTWRSVIPPLTGKK